MSNLTYERGGCIAPFLDMSRFPGTKGYVAGRICAPVPTPNGSVDCCLPCPVSDWVYSNRFNTLPKVTDWLNVGGLLCSLLLLLSYFILPVEKTSRHYLTVGLVVSVCILQMGFIVPLGSKPDQCYDSITPNDLLSDLSCAVTGLLMLSGGFATIMWGFLRSLSLHLQICWKVILGKKFFWGSILAGCAVPMAFSFTAYAVTGVSNRFGTSCLINHKYALGDYWGPLLTLAALSTILQFSTFGYCIKVYIRSLLDDSTSLDNVPGLPTYNSSVRTVTAKQAYRRIKKVVALQWRGILIVLIIVLDVTFLSIIFVSMDNNIQKVRKDYSKAEPWLLCLVTHYGDKNACLDQVGDLAQDEASVMAVLILLSLNGYWTWILLGRTSMVSAWIAFIRNKFCRSHDFVSVDARRNSTEQRNYEMIISPPRTAYKSPDAHVMASTADQDSISAYGRSNRNSKSDYFGPEVTYASPTLSFSTPRPPSPGLSPAGRDWNPQSTHAKGFRSNAVEDV